jgi:hypothetical protein
VEVLFGGLATPLAAESSFRGYNLRMHRAALFTLLAASLLTAPSWAQRGGGGHAGGGHVSGGHSGLRGHSGSRHGGYGSHRFAGNRGAWNNYGYGAIGDYPYFLPDDWYDGYDGQQEGDVPANRPPAPVVVQRIREERSPQPLPPAQVITIPSAGASVAKSLPPTVFVLNNGERLESNRFVLTAINLSLTVQRSVRTIPLDLLDIDATLAANHDRGIDLRIPNDRNEISLRF